MDDPPSTVLEPAAGVRDNDGRRRDEVWAGTDPPVAGPRQPIMGERGHRPPGDEWHELAVKMREARPGSQIRLIAVSGYGQETDVARSYAAGFDLHLVKPVYSRRLFETALGH